MYKVSFFVPLEFQYMYCIRIPIYCQISDELVLSLTLKDQKLDEQVIKFYFYIYIPVLPSGIDLVRIQVKTVDITSQSFDGHIGPIAHE